MKETTFEEDSKKIMKGLEQAYEKMIEFKKQKNTPLVISDENGKVVKIPAHELKTYAKKRKKS